MLEATTRTANIYYDGKILVTELFDDLVVETEDALENYRIVQEFMQEKKYVSLVITAPNISITKEAREDANHPERYHNCVAQAIVVNSLATRLLGNFMVRILKSHCPQRVFQSRKAAAEWLEHQWELHEQGILLK
jgi:hypothetical protein